MPSITSAVRRVRPFGAALLTLALGAAAGCTRPPASAAAASPASIEQKTLALEVAVSGSVSSIYRRVMARQEPEEAAHVAHYVSALGALFCSMQETGNFSPDDLMDAANTATIGLQARLPAEVIDAKNALVALYVFAFNDTVSVQIEHDEWVGVASGVVCQALDQALVDSGQPGIRSARGSGDLARSQP